MQYLKKYSIENQSQHPSMNWEENNVEEKDCCFDINNMEYFKSYSLNKQDKLEQQLKIEESKLNNNETVQKLPSKQCSLSNSQKQEQKKISVFYGNAMLDKNKNKQTNKVRTTKYTLLTWAPLSLLFQFKRAANIYFLIITVLTSMPFSPKYICQHPLSMIGTFAIVLFFTMLKEAYEDYKRYKSDKEQNNKKTRVFNTQINKIQEKLWSEVKVGDFLKINKDEEIPADLLCIHAPKDIIFVSTLNLDGETNLKERVLPFDNIKEENLGIFEGEIICDYPNEFLDQWDGNIYSTQLSKTYNCSVKNTLLRGCTLKNTEYCYGIVLYVGSETKMMKNTKKTPRKISNLMKLMNKMLYTVFIFQVVIILLFASLSLIWTHNNKGVQLFDISQKIGIGNWIQQFFTYWVAYSHMIPISLYVIIEMLKLGQAAIINCDVQMYCNDDQSFSSCKNSDLIEELGQVEFIFSDKTGTLTQNKMEFKKCQINNQIFGYKSEGELEQTGMCQSAIENIMNLMKIYQNQDDSQTQGFYLNQFFEFLSVCHTVVVDRNLQTNEITYQASSPDELALILGAKQLGFELVNRTAHEIEIKDHQNNTKQYYKILAEFPFDSNRKRMSLIIQYEDRFFIMTKGADSKILPKLIFPIDKEEELKSQINKDLYQFAVEGLRTLVMGKRELSKKEYLSFEQEFQQLKISQQKDKDQFLRKLYKKMEIGLNYIGVSAIEDKLQEEVPETISKLIESNIKLWVLTGDKQETAIEIGKSCKLIQEDMEQLILTSKNKKEFLSLLNSQIELRQINKINDFDELKQKHCNQQHLKRLVIIIDGFTLRMALENKEISNNFFKLGFVASTVICCRVTPKEKADVVNLAKEHGKWITLSIGDGANDVPMIQEAHIGVGIRGKEGTQAVRSADYALSQFKFLKRLLLVHGRWGYRRVSWMICYYFYKNIFLVFTEIYFAFYNGYSGQIFFADWLPMLYNAIWTSWHCLFAYLLEQDVNDTLIYNYPQLYQAGQQGKYFSFNIFWRWILFSLWHGLCCFFGVTMSLQGALNEGKTNEHWFSTTLAFTLIVHIIVYKLFIETVFWNYISGITCLLCFILYHVVVLFLNLNSIGQLIQPQINGQYLIMLGNSKFWFLFFGLPAIALLPDFTYLFIQKIFYPNPTDKIMMVQQATYQDRKATLYQTQIIQSSKQNNDDQQYKLDYHMQSQVDLNEINQHNSQIIGIQNESPCNKNDMNIKPLLK